MYIVHDEKQQQQQQQQHTITTDARHKNKGIIMRSWNIHTLHIALMLPIAFTYVCGAMLNTEYRMPNARVCCVFV